MKPRSQTFRATLERMPSRLNWIIIRVPEKVTKAWGTRGRLKVKGEINGFPFRTSLFPSRKGDHILLVNKKMQAEAKAVTGSLARFRLEPDTEERIASVPPELKRILNEDKTFQRWFNTF